MPGNIARVTVNLSLDRLFDYRIPESLAGEIFPGMKVNVPFGRGPLPARQFPFESEL